MSEVWAIVPAAGRGERFSNRSDKLTIHVGGLPILVRSVEALLDSKQVTGVILVVHPEKKALYQRLIYEYRHRKPVHFVDGGETRRESVAKGLAALPPEASVVLIHDAARPLLQPKRVDEAISKLTPDLAGVILAAPIHDTVKQVAGSAQHAIVNTIDRALLWRAQTPQVFHRDVVLKAHQAVPAEQPVTDDAQLVELAKLGVVEVLPGDESNLKITAPADLLWAEALLKAHAL